MNRGFNGLFNRRFDEARVCFSEVQAKDSNPNIWIGLGSIFEILPASADISSSNLKMAQDAYEAAMEVAKPIEALLSSVVSYLRLHQYLNEYHQLFPASALLTQRPNGCLVCDRIDIKHLVENRLEAYLYRRPLHPYAWTLYGWSLEARSNYQGALKAYKKGLNSLDKIAEYLVLKKNKISNDTDYLNCVENVRKLINTLSRLSAKCMVYINNNFVSSEKIYEELINFYKKLSNLISFHTVENFEEFLLKCNSLKNHDDGIIENKYCPHCQLSNSAINSKLPENHRYLLSTIK